MVYRTIRRVVLDAIGAAKRVLLWWKKPDDIYDSDDPDSIIRDLEQAGAEWVDREEYTFFAKHPHGEALVDRAYGEYEIVDELAPGSEENRVALRPK